jgi:hypothetical protein
MGESLLIRKGGGGGGGGVEINENTINAKVLPGYTVEEGQFVDVYDFKYTKLGDLVTNASSWSNRQSVGAISENKIIAFWRRSGDNHLVAKIFDITNNVITSGSEFVVNAVSSGTIYDIRVIDSSRALVNYTYSTNSCVRIISFNSSTNTITSVGSEFVYQSGGTIGRDAKIELFNSSNAVVVWTSVNNSNFLYSRVLQISGTTVGAAGASQGLYTGAAMNTSTSSNIWTSIIPDGRLVVSYRLANLSVDIICASLSGNFLSIGSPLTLSLSANGVIGNIPFGGTNTFFTFLRSGRDQNQFNHFKFSGVAACAATVNVAGSSNNFITPVGTIIPNNKEPLTMTIGNFLPIVIDSNTLFTATGISRTSMVGNPDYDRALTVQFSTLTTNNSNPALLYEKQFYLETALQSTFDYGNVFTLNLSSSKKLICYTDGNLAKISAFVIEDIGTKYCKPATIYTGIKELPDGLSKTAGNANDTIEVYQNE